jgi:hypothetical protein
MIAPARRELLRRIGRDRDDFSALLPQNFSDFSETSEFIDAGDSPKAAIKDE